jgi:TonB family protein
MNTAAIETKWVGQFINGKFPLQQWLGSSQHSAETLYSRWQATMALSHPHLVRLYDAGICEIGATPLLYVLMEYAEEDLSQIIPSRPLNAAEAGEMLPPVLEALSYIHEKGVVHGHIKPSNIMVVDNQLKLSTDSLQSPGEFGASRLEPGVFDAPESVTGAILPASDVWSLGVTLVTALTQHPPTWQNGGLVLSDDIPTAFRAVARECLRRDPAERCTLEQIKVLLRPPSIRVERVEKPVKRVEQPPAAVRPQLKPVVQPVAMVRSKRSLGPPIITALIVLVVLAGVGLLTRRTEAPATRTTTRERERQSQGAENIRSAPKKSAEPAPGPGSASPTAIAGPQQTAKASNSAILRGAVAEQVLPDVPPNARNTIRGTVRLSVRVSVGPDGKVSAATLDSPGPSRYFANLALQAARGWKFKAPQIDRNSVASEWLLRFQFGRTETQVFPVEVSPQ